MVLPVFLHVALCCVLFVVLEDDFLGIMEGIRELLLGGRVICYNSLIRNISFGPSTSSWHRAPETSRFSEDDHDVFRKSP